MPTPTLLRVPICLDGTVATRVLEPIAFAGRLQDVTTMGEAIQDRAGPSADSRSGQCKRAAPSCTHRPEWRVADKGFGFIETEKGTDVFFHHSSVADGEFGNLTPGQRVEYTLDESGGKQKGPRAASVKAS